MTQSLAERLQYHPDPRAPGIAGRRTQARVDLIRSKVNLAGKTVVDLGCSGGVFSFEFAKTAARVVAVDGDAEVIARNKEIQASLGLRNIEFVHANIDAALIRSFGKVDVTLMLSVYHHMLTHSVAYDWNEGATAKSAAEALGAVADNTGVFVFEVGYPNEGYEWCPRLPDFGPDWDQYVRRTVFGQRYASVEVCPSPASLNWMERQVLSRLSTPYKEDGMLVQRLKSAFRFDPRDLRRFYIGRKA